MRDRVIIGSIMHAPNFGEVDICRDAIITVDKLGKIASVTRPTDPNYDKEKIKAKEDKKLEIFPDDSFLLPGFVDLHIHAPQWPQLGKALDVPLEVWLMEYTFPLESKYKDLNFALRVYNDLVDTLLSHGTTTAVYFSTIHEKATRLLADICIKKGQRALIGKVVMDNHDQCPEYYRDTSYQDALEKTVSFIEYVFAMKNNSDGLIKPVVTPRFIPSCSDKALEGLGKLAKLYGCHVQTHCSESDWEHNYVLKRTGVSDTKALKEFGLLGRRTILAHCNFISGEDMDIIADKGAAIAHCPLSNIYFSNAIFPLRRAIEKSVRVGLGTDLSGGPSASMFDTCRYSLNMSRVLEEGTDSEKNNKIRGVEGSRIDFREAFHLATAGGADALDLPVGRFETGYMFDAILLSTTSGKSPISIFGDLDTLEDQLQKIIYTATRANIVSTWVSGKRVSQGI